MSKPREIWHPYVKNILIKYPKVKEREKTAIDNALAELDEEKREFFKKVFFKKEFLLTESEQYTDISAKKVRRWNKELYYRIAGHLNLT